MGDTAPQTHSAEIADNAEVEKDPSHPNSPEEPADNVPSVSVIVPIYNVERYLAQCLDSVLRQTLHSIEVICVNDGSTDGSLAIMRAYESADPRVRVLDGPNGGYGHRRHGARRLRRGAYVRRPRRRIEAPGRITRRHREVVVLELLRLRRRRALHRHVEPHELHAEAPLRVHGANPLGGALPPPLHLVGDLPQGVPGGEGHQDDRAQGSRMGGQPVLLRDAPPSGLHRMAAHRLLPLPPDKPQRLEQPARLPPALRPPARHPLAARSTRRARPPRAHMPVQPHVQLHRHGNRALGLPGARPRGVCAHQGGARVDGPRHPRKRLEGHSARAAPLLPGSHGQKRAHDL